MSQRGRNSPPSGLWGGFSQRRGATPPRPAGTPLPAGRAAFFRPFTRNSPFPPNHAHVTIKYFSSRGNPGATRERRIVSHRVKKQTHHSPPTAATRRLGT